MPWLDFGAHLAPFELPLGPLGSLCAWGSLGDPLGVPRGSLGAPWGAQGDFLRFVEKSDAQFRANVSICMRLRIKNASRNSSPDPPKVAQGPPFPTPLLAPGARMT